MSGIHHLILGGSQSKSTITVPGSVSVVDDGTYVTYTFPATAPMVISNGTPTLNVSLVLVSGGQGGGGAFKTTGGVGGQGGNVTYQSTRTLIPGSYTVTIGSGGAGAAPLETGAVGGLSQFTRNSPSPAVIDTAPAPSGQTARQGGAPTSFNGTPPSPINPSRTAGGSGGAGVPTPFGTFGGGGGDGGYAAVPAPTSRRGPGPGGPGGPGGGGPGGPGSYPSNSGNTGNPGAPNTGGAGGGGGATPGSVGSGGLGGPGVMKIRFLKSDIRL